MSMEENNVEEAKTSLRGHIKLLEAMLDHLDGQNVILKGRAMYAGYCFHRYLSERLSDDITKAVQEFAAKK